MVNRSLYTLSFIERSLFYCVVYIFSKRYLVLCGLLYMYLVYVISCQCSTDSNAVPYTTFYSAAHRLDDVLCAATSMSYPTNRFVLHCVYLPSYLGCTLPLFHRRRFCNPPCQFHNRDVFGIKVCILNY